MSHPDCRINLSVYAQAHLNKVASQLNERPRKTLAFETPTHANKKGRRYRYYVSQSLIKRGRPKGSDAGRRVPAGDIEHLVADSVTGFLRDEAAIFDVVETFVEDLNTMRSFVKQAADLARRWRDLEFLEKRRILQSLVERVEIGRGIVKIRVLPGQVPSIVDPDGHLMRIDQAAADIKPAFDLAVPATLKRMGMETKLLIDGADGGPRAAPGRSMLRLLALAHRYREMMLEAQGRTIRDLARDAGVGGTYFSRVVRLGFIGISLPCHPNTSTSSLHISNHVDQL